MVAFSFGIPLLTPPYDPELATGSTIATLALAAERSGFESCYCTDHPAPPQRWREAGGHDAFDPFVALGFAAAATTSLRLFTNLAVVPYRNPFLLAKSAATLDRLSGGRLILGAGTGYLKPEFAALGVPFEERNDRFDDFLAACRSIWSGRTVTEHGDRFEANEIAAQPTPIQDPLPIWIGGNSALTRRRIAAEAQGWIPLPNPAATARHLRTPPLDGPDDLAALRSDLLRRWDATGRDGTPAIAFAVGPDVPPADAGFSADRHLEVLNRWTEVGVTHVIHNALGTSPSEVEEHLAAYGELIVSEVNRTG